MKRKAKGIVLALLIIIILTASLSVLLKVSEKGLKEQDETQGEVLTTQENVTVEKDIEIPEVSKEYRVDIGGVEYSVISVHKTQDAGLLEYCKDENVDENGVLKDGYSYIVVELGIANNTNNKIDGTYNNIELNLYEDDSAKEEAALYMIDEGYDRIEKSDYFYYTIDSTEKNICRLVYIVDQDCMSKSIVLCVDPYGQSGAVIRGKTEEGDIVYLDVNENVKYIVLDECIKEETLSN